MPLAVHVGTQRRLASTSVLAPDLRVRCARRLVSSLGGRDEQVVGGIQQADAAGIRRVWKMRLSSSR